MGEKSQKIQCENKENNHFCISKMQKDIIIHKLKEEGCRITKQRILLLDIILEKECSCCKEIYYRASKIDHTIGMATIYRLINVLEEIGAINRKNMYKIACVEKENACIIEFQDHTICTLPQNIWNSVLEAGLEACGYKKNQKVKSVSIIEHIK